MMGCCGRAARRCGSGWADHADPGGVRRRGARHPGGGLPFVGLSAALVAQAVGPAEPQTVTLRAAKISSVALDRLSV